MRNERGFLQLHDIYNLDLSGTQLVVLSACRTGLGKEVRGEGLMGLTRGFMYAGSRSVVASLWKVDDAATVLLMNRLYENLLGNFNEPRMGFSAKTPMPKAEALHEAKRWLRSLDAVTDSLARGSSSTPTTRPRTPPTFETSGLRSGIPHGTSM